jgi:cytochrome c oxidase cbb3-type subunit III
MYSKRSSRFTRLIIVLFCSALVLWILASQAQERRLEPGRTQANSSGKRIFSTSCAGCHGLDGRGGERAPNIATSAKTQHLSDARIAEIISDGLPGTGMPAFHTLSAPEVRSVVAHLRVLQGKLESRTLPGNPVNGKEIFFGKGQCSNCHMISGAGGFTGPDLSGYGSSMSAPAILDAILRPDRMAPAGYRSAVVTTRDGGRFEGIIRNEDNFSLQLQSPDGSFHFFQKSELQSVDYRSASAMPTNYRERLNETELNDLASYLMEAGKSPDRKADGD